MSKSDRITITYHEHRYKYYSYRHEELQYDWIEEVRFKVRKKFKSFHYRFEQYWLIKSELNPSLIMRQFGYAIDEPTKWPMLPKLRVKQLHPKDYDWAGTCPKAWNKNMHIRPNRRAWKKYVYNVIHYDMADGLAYPSGKKHVYYY